MILLMLCHAFCAQSVENRLIEENTALGKERSHLADLMRNLQMMQNDLERAGNESRRRLEELVLRLESQTSAFFLDLVSFSRLTFSTAFRSELKQKLIREEDSHRQLSLRRDLDNKSYQDRIDKLASSNFRSVSNLFSSSLVLVSLGFRLFVYS